MLARRNFKDRYDNGTEISLREFLYPIMQGYDSVAVKADVELGGFDQLFNLKAGRTIQEHYGQTKQNIITFAMLEGTDGRKMSTSWGNIISIVDDKDTMFGKVMALHDDLIIKYFMLCTDVSTEEIKTIEKSLQKGENPKEIKLRLAAEIVTLYHNEKDASLARTTWIETFSKGGIPENIPECVGEKDSLIADILIKKEIVSSKTDWRRLVEEGAVTDENGNAIQDPKEKVRNVTLRIGKKRFAKIIVSEEKTEEGK
jgi:tyrosyl-tRNA synthetase